MSPITRSWVALASVGVGLIYLALVPGASLLTGSVLAVVAVAGFAWGVLVLFDPRFLVPRVAVILVLVPVAGWMLALLAGAAPDVPAFPLFVASALELFVAVALAVHLRRGVQAAAVSPRRAVLGVSVGILVMCAAVVPALVAADSADPSPAYEDGVHH